MFVKLTAVKGAIVQAEGKKANYLWHSNW
jgi:hypothetical protein